MAKIQRPDGVSRAQVALRALQSEVDDALDSGHPEDPPSGIEELWTRFERILESLIRSNRELEYFLPTISESASVRNSYGQLQQLARQINNVLLQLPEFVANTPQRKNSNKSTRANESVPIAAVGSWLLVEPLGQGGQGRTHLVIKKGDSSSERRVMKRPIDKNAVKRFKSEVEAYSRVQHDNLLRIINFDLDGDEPFVVTEYCEQGSLAELPKLHSEPLSKQLSLFLEVCRGIRHAHSNQIIHRDIKPENIFVRRDGTAVVGDFGICLMMDNDIRLGPVSKPSILPMYLPADREVGEYETTRAHG